MDYCAACCSQEASSRGALSRGGAFQDVERLTSGRSCTSLRPLPQAGAQVDGGTPGGKTLYGERT